MEKPKKSMWGIQIVCSRIGEIAYEMASGRNAISIRFIDEENADVVRYFTMERLDALIRALERAQDTIIDMEEVEEDE